MSPSDGFSYGRCVEAITKQALDEWHRTYHRGETFEDACAMHLLEVECVTKAKVGGILEVLAQVSPRKPAEATSGFARYSRIGPGTYVRL